MWILTSVALMAAFLTASRQTDFPRKTCCTVPPQIHYCCFHLAAAAGTGVVCSECVRKEPFGASLQHVAAADLLGLNQVLGVW